MAADLSPTMKSALSYAREHGGLWRFPGGFWARQGWQQGSREKWFGTSTVQALVDRGKLEYSEWHEGRTRFPVAAKISEGD